MGHIKILFASFLIISITISLNAATYYISPLASGSGNGSQSSPFTIQQAISVSAPGDVFYIAIGDYNLSSSLNFSKDGTQSNPIRWIGYISASDYSALSVDGNNSTVIRNVTNSSNGPVSMSGDYNIFEKIIFQQDYPAKQLISVGGTGVVLDSCSVKYPSNASSSSNHTVVVSGVGVTFRYSHFYNGSRTIIWVRKNSGTQADNFTMEYCTLTHATNHPPIQIMPATNSTDTSTIKRPIVRNCLFIDNPYSDGIYSRFCEQFAFYNNLFIRSSTPMSIDIHTGFHYPTGAPTDTCNSKGGIVAYNTIIENGTQNIYYNQGTNQINFVNNIFYSTASNQDFFGRFDSPNNPIYRHKFDHNLYYFTNNTFGGTNTLRTTWGSNTYWWSNFVSAGGQETHTTVNISPTFANISADDYSPLNSSSPQVGKGTPITTANGYWMDITTDFFGNPRDPNNPTVGAIEYNTGVGDIYPPNLVSASLNTTTSLRLVFSEPLTAATAQNVANYSISNGITVSSASISGSVVTLTTSEHSAGSYTVTVSNVTDLAGNLISPSNNSAGYSYDPGDVTAPELLGASITSATSLVLTFSEALNGSTAGNSGNYSINNGINVTGAQVNGEQVTLTTSNHSTGSYTVTVSNVTDLSGNTINPNSNSASYNYTSLQNLTKLPIVSTYASVEPEPMHTAEKTIDGFGLYSGDPDTRWSGQYFPQWIVYDLGDVEILYATKLSFFNWDQGRVYNYSVLVSHDSVNWSELITNITSINEEWSVEMVDSTDARFIKILFLSNNQNDWAGLWEAELWGHFKITPVELTSFSANTIDKKVVLNWQTASETNNMGFEILRSQDGSNLGTDNDHWENIGFINGAGTSSEINNYSFTDETINYISSSVYYRLKQIDFNGEFSFSNTIEVNLFTQLSYSLEQNYPNPFNPSTVIKYSIPEKTIVAIKVYDLLGSEVAEIFNGELDAGQYSTEFNATGLSSGIYFYSIKTNTFVETKKMILLK